WRASLNRHMTWRLQDALRDLGRLRELEDGPAPEDGADAALDLDEMLGSLEPRLRAVLVGRLEGRTGAEVAGELGVSRQRVYHLVCAARERLRETYGVEYGR